MTAGEGVTMEMPTMQGCVFKRLPNAAARRQSVKARFERQAGIKSKFFTTILVSSLFKAS
jgi:hypothetical protein